MNESQLVEAIKATETPKELNKLRILLVKEGHKGEAVFEAARQAFIKRTNQFKRVPLIERSEDWGPIYNPKVEQYEEIPDFLIER